MMSCAPSSLIIYNAIIVAILGIEHWLSKTEKVEAGSIIELVLTGLALIGVWFFKNKENDK